MRGFLTPASLALAMSLFSAPGFAQSEGAATNPAPPSAGRVVFVNPGKRGEVFWELVAQAMEVSARQLNFQLEVLWAERNKLTMRQLGLAAVGRAEKPDFLVLVNEESAASPIFAAAEAAGVASAFISSPLSAEELARFEQDHGPTRHLLGSLEPDMTAAGWRMAEQLVAAAEAADLRDHDGDFHILALAGDEITAVSTQRTQGMLEFVKTRPDVAIDRVLFANWNRAEAETLTTRYLELLRDKGRRLAGIWAANDPIAIGAVAALKRGGFTPGEDAFVVGLNWSAEALALIESDELVMSDGGHFLAGGWILVMLRDLVDGCGFLSVEAPRRVMFETSAIDKSAQPELVDMLKAGALERIDFSRFLTRDGLCGDYDFSRDALLRSIDGARDE